MSPLPDDAPSPRLCLIEKTEKGQEYGYNLHAERGKGQFVGTVDKGSPADRGGLRTGDRIFAVNGAHIAGEPHKRVVERIKEDPVRCELLVISEEGADWFKQHNIPVTLQLPNIIKMCKDNYESRGSASNGGSPPPGGWYQPTPTHNNNKADPVFVAPPPPGNEMTLTPKPILCRLHKDNPIEEFGFNLHAEKNRGHFIGTVDQGGIGERAGLRMGQRIVGVNGQLVYPDTPHKEVVTLIKRSPVAADLLVASEEVDRYYKQNGDEFSFMFCDEGAPQERKKAESVVEEKEQAREPEREQVSPKMVAVVEAAVHERARPLPEREQEAVAAAVGVGAVAANDDDDNEDDLLNQVFSGLPPVAPLVITINAQPEPPADEVAVVMVVPEEPEQEEEEEQEEPEQEEEEEEQVEPEEAALEVAAAAEPTHAEYYAHSHVSSSPRSYADSRETASPASSTTYNNGYTLQMPPAVDDIFCLSAKEARERLRQQRNKRDRALDMSLEEKYRLVSNM